MVSVKWVLFQSCRVTVWSYTSCELERDCNCSVVKCTPFSVAVEPRSTIAER